jgi:hypothetical protein
MAIGTIQDKRNHEITRVQYRSRENLCNLWLRK